MKSSFNLNNGVLNYKTIIFIIFSVILSLLYIFSSFPIFNKTVYSTSEAADQYPAGNSGTTDTVKINLVFEKPLVPSVADYFIINMKAENIKGVPYPTGSISVILAEQPADQVPGHDNSLNDKSEIYYIYRERSKIFIDGLIHNYYIPIGENRYYTIIPPEIAQTYARDKKNQDEIRQSISSLALEIPEIEGVKIEINKIELKKRTFFALDSHINYFIKNYFKISYINRYQTPACLFIIFLSIMYYLFIFLFKANLIKNKKGSFFTGAKGSVQSEKPLTGLTVIIIALAALTTVYFMGTNALFTVKSYWDSYKKYILEGRPGETYYGFYNFEKFISWIDENIPEGENLIVPLRGEPVYIMAEMAYNLYPRDIMFLNIIGMSNAEVLNKIENITIETHTGKSGSEKSAVKIKNYGYIIFLSASDIIYSEKLQFMANYRKTGGYIYMLNSG